MNPIYLTEKDYQRLLNLIQIERANGTPESNIARLAEEVKRAHRVLSEEIPADVITMNSRVKLKELKSGNELEIALVYPKDADIKTRKISVLAPIGTAIIGCKTGDKIEWPGPAGTLTYQVMEILFQPEATGDFNL